MIARTFVILAAAIGSTTAFTVQPLGRTSMQLMGGNPDVEAQLKNDPQLKEASRATINECDDTECAIVQCEQDARGNWNCTPGLDGEGRETTATVLMSSNDDDE